MQDHALKYEGGEVSILNEDEILATIQDPERSCMNINNHRRNYAQKKRKMKKW
jgi:hypothetical protein